jgi:hypothetical protein
MLARFESLAADRGLIVLGGFHPGIDAATMLLLGPDEPTFWTRFTASDEYRDGRANPLDRWSQRVIGDMAATLGGVAHFPFGGPPYDPFYDWALRSGQAWVSPVGLLVHATRGLFVSYRGAIAIPERIALPDPAQSPCPACAKPCLTACPVNAFGATYDVPGCKAHLDTEPGQDCMTNGCAVRRACPVGHDRRMTAQSAFHMKAFHPK